MVQEEMVQLVFFCVNDIFYVTQFFFNAVWAGKMHRENQELATKSPLDWNSMRASLAPDRCDPVV